MRAMALVRVASALMLVACGLEPVSLAPPGAPSASPASEAAGAPAAARVTLRVPISPDDGAGLDLVTGYTLLRQGAGDEAPVPFEYTEAEFEDGTPERVFYDTSASPGRSYRYVAYALAESEVRSFGAAGGPASPSAISPEVRAAGQGVAPPTAQPPRDLLVTPLENDAGYRLRLEFAISVEDDGRISGYEALRASAPEGPFAPFPEGRFWSGANAEETGGLAPDPELHVETIQVPGHGPWFFRVYAIPVAGEASAAHWDLVGTSPVADLFNEARGNVALVVLLVVVLSLVFLRRARRGGNEMFIRRIPGVDAIEEAVGRATEMGRPVLYVPGIDEIQNIQTIASILILGRVSEMVARYDTEIQVPCCIPLVAAVGEEVVRQGFYDAGRPDAHRPQNVQWISSQQFAFCAGTNGLMLREKPATNIYLGRFFAESLILAETGYVNRAIQIAGTAEIAQLPFFIAACDYTLIGEELYAVSAYMTRDPKLLSTLRAADWVKALCIGVLLVGAVAAVLEPGGVLASWLSDASSPWLSALLGAGG